MPSSSTTYYDLEKPGMDDAADIRVLNENLDTIDDALHTLDVRTTSVLSVDKGGTGSSTHTANSILVGNGQNAVNHIPTADGAMYANATNGAPQFGTLPIAQGGTGATTAAAAASAITNGQALTPASVTATGTIKGATISDSVGTLAQLRESVSFLQVDDGTVISDSPGIYRMFTAPNGGKIGNFTFEADGKIYSRISTDGGNTWTEWKTIAQ